MQSLGCHEGEATASARGWVNHGRCGWGHGAVQQGQCSRRSFKLVSISVTKYALSRWQFVVEDKGERKGKEYARMRGGTNAHPASGPAFAQV